MLDGRKFLLAMACDSTLVSGTPLAYGGDRKRTGCRFGGIGQFSNQTFLIN